MAWVMGGKHFGQYTYEHWFDEDLDMHEGSIAQKELITLFVNYNRSVNRAMDGIIKTLSPEEWQRPLGGYFKSVRGLCSHIYICDFNWLKRFRSRRMFATLSDPFFDRDYSFAETIFADMGEYLEKRPGLDSRMSAFADELNEEDLGGILKFTDSHGRDHEWIFGGCVLQFLNHETHHRGMISVYLEMLGRENDFSSLAQVLE